MVPAAGLLFAPVSSAAASDSFWLGMDSGGPTATSASCASGWYCMPSPLATGQEVGDYIGEDGTWDDMRPCGDSYAGRYINWTDVSDATSNNGRALNYGVWVPGASAYWFLGGPGADPNFNYTTYSNSQAYSWGVQQANAALSEYQTNPYSTSLVMFMDIEGPSPPPYPQYNGWNEQVYSDNYDGHYCGERENKAAIATNLDRNTFNGFWDTLTNSSYLSPGVYSSQQYWIQTMGNGLPCDPTTNPNACIPDTPQWASQQNSPSVTPAPDGWTQGGGNCNGNANCAAGFFGHVNIDKQFVWQWSTAGGGDWDQTNTTNFSY